VLFKVYSRYADAIRNFVSINKRPRVFSYFFNFSIRSCTSCDRFAIRIRLTPIPAGSIFTIDNSLLSCRNSIWPFVSWRTCCIRSVFANFMDTCRFGPSICIVLMPFSGSCIFSYIHSCIWKAVIRGLRMSNAHTSVFCRSLMSFMCALCSSLNSCTTLNNTTSFTFCRFSNTRCSCSTHNHSALRFKADW
jgi:hypothetical protein